MAKGPGNGEIGGADMSKGFGLGEGEGFHAIVFCSRGGDTLDLGMDGLTKKSFR